MADGKPPVTGTQQELPFEKLSPRDFERLCLWFVEREGFEQAEHLDAAGNDQGCDIIAWLNGKRWAFQCKRVRSFGSSQTRNAIDKVLALPEAKRPAGLVFFVTCDVPATTRDEARERWSGSLGCHFLAGSELETKVKRHPDILEEFFRLPGTDEAPDRVVEPLFRAAADPDPEVAGRAVQALLEMGEAVREQALALARQPEQALYQAGLRYLGGLLGQPVVWVPLGPFLMGSDRGRDPKAYGHELPRHEATVPGYWIGRYPVTVARFRAFVEASGYQPADRRSLRGEEDHPVVRVTWHDAVAYCRWLSDTTGLWVRLPSEPEWEKAARGRDGRIYPWGDEWDAGRCNSREGGRGDTTPVGQYSPDGDSPYGCADMAGNVREWCATRWGKSYPYDVTQDEWSENYLRGEGGRVLRGGSWFDAQSFARCAARFRFFPGFKSGLSGYRLVSSI